MGAEWLEARLDKAVLANMGRDKKEIENENIHKNKTSYS